MKKFVYVVLGRAWVDSEPWGVAWQAAKAEAAEKNAVIGRLVLKDDEVIREEIFGNGAFVSAKLYVQRHPDVVTPM